MFVVYTMESKAVGCLESGLIKYDIYYFSGFAHYIYHFTLQNLSWKTC